MLTNSERVNDVRVRALNGSYPKSFINKIDTMIARNIVGDMTVESLEDMLILLNIVPKLATKASKMTNISTDEFFGSGRGRDKTTAQMIVVFLLIDNGFYSKQILAESIGRKKHSTSFYLYKKCAWEKTIYTEINTMIKELHEYAIQEFSNELSKLNHKSTSKWSFTQTEI